MSNNELLEDLDLFNYAAPYYGSVSEVLPTEISLASSDFELDDVLSFRKSICKNTSYGALGFCNDGFDDKSHVLYTKDADGNIIATVRVLPNSEYGFPEESLISSYTKEMRVKGKRIAEAGRFAIVKNKHKLLRLYYKAIHDIAIQEDIEIVIMIIKTKSVSSYQNMMSIDVVANNIGCSWDVEQDNLSLVAWNIGNHQPRFDKWVSRKEIYSKKSWDNYSCSHLSVLTSIQKEVYEHVAKKASSNVLDIGCGSGRIMAYLQDNNSVLSYTGVDLSGEMINQANWLKNELHFDEAELVHSRVENLVGSFDYIYSVHSYYAWENKSAVLSHIYNLLDESGIFILVTPNNNFDKEKLFRIVKQEILGHPHYNEFLRLNQDIADKAENNNLYTHIDNLVEKVRNVGFKVNTAHNEFFLGGASYLELTK